MNAPGKPRKRRIFIAIAIILGLQLAAVLIWYLVEQGRSAAPTFRSAPDTLRPAPPLTFESASLTRDSLTNHRGPVLLHFWASWCAPCRDELPLLQVLASTPDLPFTVVAVAVDDTWPNMRRLPGIDMRRALRALDRRQVDAFDISALPVTLLLDANHRRLERYEGARDWSHPAARAHLEATLARSAPTPTPPIAPAVAPPDRQHPDRAH